MTNTKSVQLTEDEVRTLIANHGGNIYNASEYDKRNTDRVERLKYLDKRLKDFKEPEIKLKLSETENPNKEPMSSW